MGLEVKISQDMERADLSNLGHEAERMIEAGVHSLHLDICDGYFVPHLTFGPSVVASLWERTKAYLDCHLMVTNPLDYVVPLAAAGASGFTFHVEASKDNWRELILKIKAKGMRPGVALKTETPVEEVFPLVEDEYPVEMVLVMTAENHVTDNNFLPEMLDKVRTFRERYPKLDIQVDGCVGLYNIQKVTRAGANCLVSGAGLLMIGKPREFLDAYKTLAMEFAGHA